MGLFKAYWQKFYRDASAITSKLCKEKLSTLRIIAFEAPDPNVRTEAVRYINDSDVLKQIALKSSHKKVRKAAFDRISDRDFLLETAFFCENEEIRKQAFYAICEKFDTQSDEFRELFVGILRTTQKKFSFPCMWEYNLGAGDYAKIISMDMELKNRKIALKKVKGDSQNDPHVMEAVSILIGDIKKLLISDAADITEITDALDVVAQLTQFDDVRYKQAILKLVDVFPGLICSEKKQKCRIQALRTIGDSGWQEQPQLAPVIAKMAKEEKDPHVRWEAVCCTNDEEALCFAARHDREWPIRETAVEKLVKGEVLSRMVEETLICVASNDSDDQIREKAKERLGTHKLQRKVKEAHRHSFNRITLYEKNEKGRMEPISQFKTCKICGDTFCCDELYKEEPMCDFTWTRRHIDTFSDAERVCFSCEETDDSIYGYIMKSDNSVF